VGGEVIAPKRPAESISDTPYKTKQAAWKIGNDFTAHG
jgi:hypothetical protein